MLVWLHIISTAEEVRTAHRIGELLPTLGLIIGSISKFQIERFQMQTFMPQDKVYRLMLGEIGPDSPVRGLPDAAAADDPQTMQNLTTAYITTMYYSALSNLYFQGLLPADRAAIDAEMPRFKIAYERTYADYTAASEWLAANGGGFIATSPAKQYYDEVRSMGEGVVMDIASAYAQAS